MNRSEHEIRRFSECMASLERYFEKPIDETMRRVYFAGLEDLPIELIERAAFLAFQQCKWLPKIAELRQLVEGTGDDVAQRAWDLFLTACERVGYYNSIWIDDAALVDSIRVTFGGWTQACTALHPVFDEKENQVEGLSPEMVASKRKEFLLNYRNAQRRGCHDHYLLGCFEIENRANVGNFKRGALLAKQPVGIVMAGKVGVIDLEIDAHTGQLASASRQMLEGGEGIRLLSAAPRLALPEYCESDAPVMSLDEAIVNVAEGLSMLRDGLPENLRSKRTPERKPVDVAARYKELKQQAAMLEDANAKQGE